MISPLNVRGSLFSDSSICFYTKVASLSLAALAVIRNSVTATGGNLIRISKKIPFTASLVAGGLVITFVSGSPMYAHMQANVGHMAQLVPQIVGSEAYRSQAEDNDQIRPPPSAFLYHYSQHRMTQAASWASHVRVLTEKEEAGNYAAALELARAYTQKALLLGGAREVAALCLVSTRLEQELLTLGASRRLFDEQRQPRALLVALLSLAGWNASYGATLSDVNAWAQKTLLRNGERWEEQTGQFEPLKAQAMPILQELGFVDTVLPHFREYQGAMVYGALLSTVRLRLHYLIEQWNQGVRFSHLYFLGSERPLDSEREGEVALHGAGDALLTIRQGWVPPTELPKTEHAMLQWVWDQADIPEEMRVAVTVVFVNAPMKKDPHSDRWLRPTTDDTLICWRHMTSPRGRYLGVTNAPYLNRQDIVSRTLAPEYEFDTVGYGLRGQETVAIIFDEVARTIFQSQRAFSP